MIASIGNDPGMIAFSSAIVLIGVVVLTIHLIRTKQLRSHKWKLSGVVLVTAGLVALPLTIEPQPIPALERTHIWNRYEISELERRAVANECLRYVIEDEALIWTICDQR